MNGPTPAPTSARPSVSPPSPTSSITTITTAATPHSRAPHPPAAYPTSVVSTASLRDLHPHLHHRGDHLRAQFPTDQTTGRGGLMSWFRDVGWRHLAAVTAVIYAVFPLIYVLSASLSASGRLGDNRLFRTISLANYQELLTSGNYPYLAWFTNTLIIGLTTSMITVFMGSAAAYAFSRFRFTGRRAGLASLLVIQMFPQLLAFIAIFLLLLTFRDVFPVIGLNTRLGLILVYLGGALGVNTFLMYGFFNTVPREIDEAAKIDGASHSRIFLTIVLRLVAPVLAVVGLLSFVGTFSEYLIASLVLQDVPKQTLAVGLFQFISQQHSERWGMFAAGSILAAIPVVVLFQFLQRYIVAGLTSGSVKG